MAPVPVLHAAGEAIPAGERQAVYDAAREI
jgi:hypothetical protein